jgi:hypothetical protein
VDQGQWLQFVAFDFNPNEPGVDKVTLEGPNGDHVLSTVHFTAIATQDDGKEVAAKVTAAALDRLTYHHGIAIEDARITGHQFSPLVQSAGAQVITMGTHLSISGTAAVALSVPPATLKQELEQVSPLGERNFSLFRSALLSPSPVEAFMHLYNLLPMNSLLRTSLHVRIYGLAADSDGQAVLKMFAPYAVDGGPGVTAGGNIFPVTFPALDPGSRRPLLRPLGPYRTERDEGRSVLPHRPEPLSEGNGTRSRHVDQLIRWLQFSVHHRAVLTRNRAGRRNCALGRRDPLARRVCRRLPGLRGCERIDLKSQIQDAKWMLIPIQQGLRIIES